MTFQEGLDKFHSNSTISTTETSPASRASPAAPNRRRLLVSTKSKRGSSLDSGEKARPESWQSSCTPPASAACKLKPLSALGAPSLNFSFSGGGWLQFWMFGVAKALIDHGFHQISADQVFIGSSAGALSAALLAMDCTDFNRGLELCKACIPSARATLRGLFKISDYLKKCIPAALPLQEADTLDGNLAVVVTKVTPRWRTERITEFSDGDHLRDALLASAACVPAAEPVKLSTGWAIDGGFTDFQPCLHPELGETIYICPFYFASADIKPSRYVPVGWALVPPNDNGATVDWLYDLGYCDALSWIQQRGWLGACNHSEKDGDILTCKMRPPRAEHPFDKPGPMTVHRILGYGEGHRTFDMMLVGILLCLQPLAYLLIMVELKLLVMLLVIRGIIKEVIPLLPFLVLCSAVLLPRFSFKLLLIALGVMLIIKLLVTGTDGEEEWVAVGKHLLGISHVALRAIPGLAGRRRLARYPREILDSSMLASMSKHFL